MAYTTVKYLKFNVKLSNFLAIDIKWLEFLANIFHAPSYFSILIISAFTYRFVVWN